MSSLDWENSVRPVLVAVYRVVERTPPDMLADSGDVMEELGWESADADTLYRILDNLKRAGYIEGDPEGGGGWTFLRLREPALQLMAGWPGAADDQAAAKLIELVDQRLQETEDPDERTKLRKLRDGLVDVGRGVVTGLLTDLARGGF